jgi:hypothetical protein
MADAAGGAAAGVDAAGKRWRRERSCDGGGCGSGGLVHRKLREGESSYTALACFSLNSTFVPAVSISRLPAQINCAGGQ